MYDVQLLVDHLKTIWKQSKMHVGTHHALSDGNLARGAYDEARRQDTLTSACPSLAHTYREFYFIYV